MWTRLLILPSIYYILGLSHGSSSSSPARKYTHTVYFKNQLSSYQFLVTTYMLLDTLAIVTELCLLFKKKPLISRQLTVW